VTSTPIDLYLIDPPAFPHRVDIDPDELLALRLSIQTIGQLQPILVKRVGQRFEVIFGHRRYLAQRANFATTIDCVIEDNPTPDRDATTQLVENFERVDRPQWKKHARSRTHYTRSTETPENSRR